MLGSDPVYQFDYGMDAESGADACQKVITLEPVYNSSDGGGGGEPKWVDWFLKENYNGDCLTFGYAQAGQENSFGWNSMRDGLIYQFAEFERLQKEGRIEVEPLGETGRWFKKTYSATPASAIAAHSAWDDPDKQSLWYSSRFYRANIYADHGAVRIRDLHIFNEKYPDPYEDKVCTGNEASYETLPVTDGNRHTGKGIIGGLYPLRADGTPISCGSMQFADLGDGKAEADCGGVKVVLAEDRMEITAEEGFRLERRMAPGADHVPEITEYANKLLNLKYDGVDYSIRLLKGCFANESILSEDGCIVAVFA